MFCQGLKNFRCAQGLNSHLVPVTQDVTLHQVVEAQFQSVPASGGFALTPNVNGKSFLAPPLCHFSNWHGSSGLICSGEYRLCL